MKKNIIFNVINIVISILFMTVLLFTKENPLSRIMSFIIIVTNILLSIYSMGISEHPKIKIGNIEGSVVFSNIAAFIMQIFLIVASLSDSFWLILVALLSTFVFIECIMVFLKDLFRYLRFRIAITFTISFPTLILYCILLGYRNFNFKFPTTIFAIILIVLYVVLIFKEKNIIKITSYSAIFNMALILLAVGDFTSQGIYSSILFIISYTPVMFLLMTACSSISDRYGKLGVSRVDAVFSHLPISGAGFMIGLLSIMGFPPFSLFFGRLNIIQSDVTAGDYIRTALIVVTLAVSSYFVLSRVMPVLFGPKDKSLVGIKENKYSAFIMLLLGTLSLLLTILIPGLIYELINTARAYVLGIL